MSRQAFFTFESTKMPPTKLPASDQNTFKKAGLSVTSPKDNLNRQEVSVQVGQAIMVFYIGGAGDKESYYGTGPYGNIDEVRKHCDLIFKSLRVQNLYFTDYLGYNEVCGKGDVQKHVIEKIPDKMMPVYIVGHSLGGWNGAHLSRILNEHGYNVEMLITLDPVGEGFGVHAISDLYGKYPRPVAKFWINIRADKAIREMDGSDGIALVGGQWTVKEGPNLNFVADIHHANALKMFLVPLTGKASARDYFYASVKKTAFP
jgi:hypothetical protein